MTPEQLDEIEKLADVEHGRGLDFGDLIACRNAIVPLVKALREAQAEVTAATARAEKLLLDNAELKERIGIQSGVIDLYTANARATLGPERFEQLLKKSKVQTP